METGNNDHPEAQGAQRIGTPTTQKKMNEQCTKNMIAFLRQVNKLKHLSRTGWVRNGIENPESVASHMWRMGIMSMLITSDCQVNKERCLKMCLIHDLAECIVGDITPHDGVSEEDKHQIETNAIEQMRNNLLYGLNTESDQYDKELKSVVDEMLDLFEEYEQNATPEAKLVKDFDKFDMILQADEYEKEQNKELSSFFNSTMGKFQTDLGKNLAKELYSQRVSRMQQDK
jgi:putative hydrolase of HD superfamily